MFPWGTAFILSPSCSLLLSNSIHTVSPGHLFHPFPLLSKLLQLKQLLLHACGVTTACSRLLPAMTLHLPFRSALLVSPLLASGGIWASLDALWSLHSTAPDLPFGEGFFSLFEPRSLICKAFNVRPSIHSTRSPQPCHCLATLQASKAPVNAPSAPLHPLSPLLAPSLPILHLSPRAGVRCFPHFSSAAFDRQ